MKHSTKILLLFLAAFLSTNANQLFGQTVSSSTIITPVCQSSSGEIQLTFTNVNSYPFVVIWYGNGIENGRDTITSSTQNLTLLPGYYTYGQGYYIDLYNVQYQYLGRFEAGISYNISNANLAPTCTTPALLNVTNIRNGTAPYTVSLLDDNNNTLASGSSPLQIPFNTVCPIAKRVTLKVTDSNGCYFLNNDTTISISCKGLTVNIGNKTASCTNGMAMITSVTGNTGPYTYLWNNGATTDSIKNLRQGTYSCIVTDSVNCSGYTSTYVIQSVSINSNSTIKAANCNSADGQATIFATGGTAPYTYKWSNNFTGQTNTTLAKGLHIVSIEDAKQCTGTGYVYIDSKSPIFVNFTATASSCTSATGTATLSIFGGQTPYTIVWHGRSSTSTTITGLPPGPQSFTVTDANGCTNSGAVIIPPISVISASISDNKPICPNNNGSLTVSASSTAGIASFNWSNGQSTTTISNLSIGYYKCVITDNNGCIVEKSIYLDYASPVVLRVRTKDASCIFNADGSATAVASGGTAPYTYTWSDGSNTASISSKKSGQYSVSVRDANGCYNKNWVMARIGYNPNNNSCYCVIKGNVFDDLDSNCTKNTNEENIFNTRVTCSGIGSTFTDYSGNYSFKVPAGNYTITQTPLYNSNQSPCQNNNIAVSFTTVGGGCNQVIDFGNVSTPYHDIVIFPVINMAPIPGKNYNYRIIMKNEGNRNESSVNFTLFEDGRLNYATTSGVTLNSLGNGLYKPSAPISISKGQSHVFWRYYFTPTTLTLGTICNFRDSAAYTSPISLKWIDDEASPWNNIHDYDDIVVSSYDPNQKNVYPQGIGEKGIIPLEQKQFTYVVQFENNGTANADKVVIIDTLDADLDWSTFKTLDASHGVDVFIDLNGVVTFTFDRINLAYTPKGVYEPAAQGYVSYSIKAKSNVGPGTQLTNFADIYFDYNAPVRTNTTINTYATDTTNIPSLKLNEHIALYPNPNNGSMQLSASENLGKTFHLEIYNLQGQILDNILQYEINTPINTQQLPVGIYILKVTTMDGRVHFVKFIRQ
jgi:hypothetical protein